MHTYDADTEALIRQALPPFPDRLAYVAWRAEWRTKYQSLSSTIRTLKRDIAQGQKDGNLMAHSMSDLASHKNIAHIAMIKRAVAKAVSREMRQMRLAKAA